MPHKAHAQLLLVLDDSGLRPGSRQYPKTHRPNVRLVHTHKVFAQLRQVLDGAYPGHARHQTLTHT